MNAAELCARDLMQKNVKTVTEKTALRGAAKMMHESEVSSVVVERENERDALGILTRKDVIEGLISLQTSDSALLVGDVMTKPAITVAASLSIEHCLQTMRMVGVRRMPVVEGDKLVGILSNTDVFRRLVTEDDEG